jgi:hypothetical protein
VTAGLSACPALDRALFAAEVVAAMAGEVAKHPGICVATLPAVPAATTQEAVGIGQERSAALLEMAPTDLDARTGCATPPQCAIHEFAGLAVQGTSGAAEPLLPFARIVARRANGLPVTYAQAGDARPNAFAIVGTHDGIALGIVITAFGRGCAR